MAATQARAEELEQGLPHVLAAPRDAGPVTMLCFRPALNKRVFPESLRLTRAEGIPGDRWLSQPWLKQADGSPDPRIQVAIIRSRVVDLVWRDREGTPHPGDTITADLDLSEANLPPGTLLQAGSALLRVSDVPNDGCAKWKVRYGPAALDWVQHPDHAGLRLRGLLCEVWKDGEVRRGDMLTVLR